MNPRFFANKDVKVPGPARDLVGYGEHPPKIKWRHDARVALQIAVNYEEGSELSFAMGDGENDSLHEMPTVVVSQRDLAAESTYEYGSRAGIWRLFRIFDAAGVDVTFFASAIAFERNPPVAQAVVRRGYDVAGHGYRWSHHWEMSREEERVAILRAVQSLERTTGTRPRGWYCRKMSVNTRQLLVEIGGFTYDSDCYNDDLPYWTEVAGRAHLVLPYSVVANDARFVVAQGYSSPQDFFDYARMSLDRLRHDGDDVNRMMSLGLHPRLVGNPARADSLARFIEYAQSCQDVWIARRVDIADAFIEQFPAPDPIDFARFR